MKTKSEQILFQGVPVIKMTAGSYEAIIAPTIGSNIARLRNTKENIEIFRFDKKHAMKKLAACPEIYGLPTLYLPNRLNHGILRVSDATYHLPITDSEFQNHMHGFLHRRNHTVMETLVQKDTAIAKTQYIYDEKDPFFKYFPVKFQADYEFKLDEKGMHYNFTLTNRSDRQMPYGVCNHTAFQAPFIKNGKKIHVQVPVTKRCILNERQLSTGKLHDLSAYDEQYLNGTKLVTKTPINNDMYTLTTGTLDGKPFYGAVMTDAATGKRICYEVDKAFKFFIFWNDRGTKDYYCPEPMTWMIDAPNLDLPAEVTGYIELAPKESKTVTEHIFTI